MKVFGEGRFALSQILSVWQDWFAFKPDPIIKHQLELSGTRVKYLDNEKMAYTHEILSYRIHVSEKASYNLSFWRVQSEVVWSLRRLCEKRKPWRGHAYMQAHAGSSEPSPHADEIRTIISCADQFIELIFHCGPFILFSYSVYNLNS